VGTLVEVKDAVEAHVCRVSGHSKASSAIGVALQAQLHLDLAVDTLDDGLKSVGFHQRLDGSLHNYTLWRHCYTSAKWFA